MSGHVRLAGLLAVAAFAAACGSEPHPAPAPEVAAWRIIGTWSGHGNAQLETFPIERWDWRIKWQTTDEKPAGAGTFHATVHSADSGRMIVDLVDARGEGHDTVDISEQPHRFYLVVVSANVDWALTVEEPVLR